MEPKPAHLGLAYAAQFADPSVVAAYHHRPPYPDEIFAILTGLLPAAGPRMVLDAGCGTGDLARRVAPLVARIDAVDRAALMVAKGRTLPGGKHPHMRWRVGDAETAPLDGPYGLITAGESLHWFDWAVVMPRWRAVLAPGGVLAIVERGEQPQPWHPELFRLINRYSTNREFRPYDIINELTRRRLFRERGRRVTAPAVCQQSASDYVESIHSRNGFSRDRMPADDAAAFDAAVHALLTPYAPDGTLRFTYAGTVVWGDPAP